MTMQSLLPPTLSAILGFKPKDAQFSSREYPNNMKLLLFEHEEEFCPIDFG